MVQDQPLEPLIIEEDQALLSAVLNSSGDAIISHDREGVITGWNNAAAQIFGYAEKEAIGKNVSVVIPEATSEEKMHTEDTMQPGRKTADFETTGIAKDGSKKNISLRSSPVRNSKGVVTGALHIARDIADKSLVSEKQAVLAAIVESSDDAIISKTLEGMITSWNRAATEMFGFTEQEVLGKHISIIIPAERIDEETLIISSIRSGKKIDHFETIRVAKDGTQKSISLTVSPVKNYRGEIVGASKVARDISEKKEAERQRELYTRKLQELNDYKDEFMVMASHELKTPLTVILTNLQIMEYVSPKDKNTRFLTTTIKHVKKMSSLITNLLDVSKIQVGKLTLEKTAFDLVNLIGEVADNLQQTTKNHILSIHAESKIMVDADRNRIEQVITNLIGNAIKYSPGGGQISVRVAKEGQMININVSDEGIGIPPEDLENIFQRFYRVGGLASSFSGSGVGLFISMEIVKAHGGKMWASSECGKYSVFHFSLPA